MDSNLVSRSLIEINNASDCMTIEVIDLFAGPGGLGEGFSSFKSDKVKPFKIKISIEKEKFAHQTLILRSFYRQFKKVPEEYYEYLRGKISKEELYLKYPVETKKALAEAYWAELGGEDFPHHKIIGKIRKQLKKPKNSIVIGGPPCQAYSLVGRSTLSKNEEFENDPRHNLYREYLRIIADIQPVAFVMENVKGLLSSKLNGEYIIDQIIEDIRTPSKIKYPKIKKFSSTEKYNIYSLSRTGNPKKFKPRDFVIQAEKYGIPQCRHRVILLAVRSDISKVPSILKLSKKTTSVSDVISDLPILRSGLSKDTDSYQNWKESIQKKFNRAEIYNGLSRGHEYIEAKAIPSVYKHWFHDKNLGGVINHSTRAHIVSDLHRYYFSAQYALEKKKSPKLEDFPLDLLPNHKNVKSAIKTGTLFNDRFRVQLANKPATTIISHISKDGHYFIHYDPKQCRSLTVREAARIQTFPDNYKFEGPRTVQYQQVGNAVPPLLAHQIAKVVYDLLTDS